MKPPLIISTVIVCVMNCSAPNRRMKMDKSLAGLVWNGMRVDTAQ